MRVAPALLAATALAISGCAASRTAPTSGSPPPASATPNAPSPAPPARARPALPPLRPQLSEADEQRLRDDATRQIAEAERTALGIKAESLPSAQRETVGSIQDFIRQARQALAARDYDRATTLAKKAQSLAQDLSQNTR